MRHPANIKKMWEKTGDKEYFSPGYDAIVEGFGAKVEDRQSLGSYQGDLLYLLRDGRHWGFLVVGYGSCSGCDALEACRHDINKIQALADDLYREVEWLPPAAMIKHLEARDGANAFWLHHSGAEAAVERFINQIKETES